MLNSDVLSCLSGVIMSTRWFFSIYMSHLIQFFTLSTEVKNYILFTIRRCWKVCVEERTLELILAHLRYPLEELPPSLQDSRNKAINISFYLFRKNDMKSNQTLTKLYVSCQSVDVNLDFWLPGL